MRPDFVMAGAALALLAACDDAPAPREVPSTEAGEATKARIDALDPAQRDALFLRAIRDAGQECQRVEGSAHNGLHFGMPSWVARCRDGRDWLVMLRPDGSALVARREETGAP